MLVDEDGIFAKLNIFTSVGGIVCVHRIAIVEGDAWIIFGVIHSGYDNVGQSFEGSVAVIKGISVDNASPVAVVSPLIADGGSPEHGVG